VIVAAIQYRPPKGEPEIAREALCTLVREALDSGARLVVCPEMSTTGYVWESADALRPYAERRSGRTAEALGALAAEYSARIVAGFVEVDQAELFNSAMVLAPNGDVEAVYRKNMLFELDVRWATPGTARTAIRLPRCTLVPGICMDLNDDDFVEFVQTERATIVPFCTNWLEQGIDVAAYWAWRLRDWRGWFVAANSWGPDDGIEFSGRSAILAPGGLPVRRAPPRGDCVITFDTQVAYY
jgi:predicted amidohydrolase